jgi:hypothetical protein
MGSFVAAELDDFEIRPKGKSPEYREVQMIYLCLVTNKPPTSRAALQ